MTGDLMKGSVLAASVAAIGLAAAVSACGGSASTTQTSSTPASSAPASASPSATTPTSESAAVPAGYKRIGGVAQGVSLAVPSSWVTVNFAQQTIQEAIRKIGLHGISQATLTQDMQALQKLHAIYAVDIKSAVSSPGHFSSNVNAYCTNSGVTESGSAGVPILRQSAAAELQQIGGHNLTQTDVQVGGVPGVQTSYTLSTSGAGTLHAAQLEVLPKPDRACFVTLTAAGPLPRAVLAQIAPSVQYT
jgi:hypothetical protein